MILVLGPPMACCDCASVAASPCRHAHVPVPVPVSGRQDTVKIQSGGSDSDQDQRVNNRGKPQLGRWAFYWE
eukprot:scaffold14068_cov119-Isochrysis_galbana.AAC.27